MPRDEADGRILPIDDGGPVVLFDGVCNLCDGTVRFIIRRDRRGVFRFASLESAASRRVLGAARRVRGAAGAGGPRPDSIVLIESGRVYTRSTAVLRVFRRLRFPWPLLFALIAVPRVIRDWVYDRVAERRYRWFGRRDAGVAPTAEVRARFLE